MAGTVFIGFDSMDAHLTRQWAADGLLPNFARVFESWTSLPTQNPEGLLVGGLWPAFWSGGGPAHHGSYCWRQLVPGTYTTAEMRPTDFDTEPFWLRLDQAGVRCAIFDMPLVRPIPLRYGVHIVDWGTHDSQLDCSISDARVAAHFETLGRYPQKRCDITVEEHGRERLASDLHTGVRMRSDALGPLLAGKYDLVATVFSETHCSGHQLYHLHDTEHPLHDAEMRARLGGDPMLQTYRDVDNALGRAMEHIPADAGVMLLFSHGFGDHYDGNPMLDEVLARIAQRFRPATPAMHRRERVLQRVRGAKRRLLRTLLPRRNHPHNLRLVDGTAAWFGIPNNDLYGAVRINVRGREPRGRVRPGKDLAAAVQTITDELLALRHESTGTPAVRRVIRTDDYHRGPARNRLPDLIVEWNWDEPFVALTSSTIGTVTSGRVALRTGDHRTHGEVFVRNLTLPAVDRVPVEALGAVLVSDALSRR